MILTQSTILVVDDEQFFRDLYQDLLAEEGYRIETCGNGEAAISRMQREPVDLVLTDMAMPGKCGLEVLRAARLLPNPPEVILVTGNASIESAIQALKNGARDYLIKPFDPDELKHLVRTCLEQRRLLAENQQLKSQIQLFQTGQTLSSLIDLNRLFPEALDALLRQVNATQGCGFILKSDAGVQLPALKNLRNDVAYHVLEELLPQLDDGGVFQTLKNVQLTNEAIDASRCGLLSLREGGQLKGGCLIVNAPHDLLQLQTDADLHYLCEQISLGFENASRFEDAQELMYTDDLTGLYNHRYMQVAMEHEIKRSQRYGLQFSLLFLDLDRFKEINDQHGHLAGSEALKQVGGLLQECVRDVDTLFRFGGDEFAAMLVETDGRTAKIVAERIRKVIEEHVFLEAQGMASHLTVTSGYATFPTDAVDKDVLLDLADRAMYAGKESRNVVHGPEGLIGKDSD